jgi:hypothetical protein
MIETKKVLSIRYIVRIKEPSTNRGCHVYFSSDRDLESLLLFLRFGKDLQYDVRDLRKDPLDP